MFGSLDIRIILFRLINTAVLVYAGVYFFKKHFLADLRNEVAQESTDEKNLQQTIDDLGLKQHDLVNAKKECVNRCTYLTEQTALWFAMVTKRQQEHELSRITTMAAYEKKMHLAIIQANEERLFKKALPVALEQAEQDLRKRFADENLGKDFIAQVVTKLGRH